MQQYCDVLTTHQGQAVCNTCSQSVCNATCKIVQTCNSIQVSPEGEVSSGGYIYRDPTLQCHQKPTPLMFLLCSLIH